MRRLILLVALLGGMLGTAQSAEAAACASNTVGAFTCVHSYAANKAATTTPAWTLPNNIGSSTNILVGAIIWNDVAGTLNSLVGSGAGCTGATITIYDNPTTNTAWRAASFSVRGVTAAGQCIITATLSSSVASAALFHELAGALSTSDPVGARHAMSAQSSPGTGTDAVTVGPVTATGTDYVFGVTLECSQGSSITAGTGWTQRENNNDFAGIGCRASSEDKSASGANTVTFTDSNATQFNFTAILSVQVAGGGATAPPSQLLLGAGGIPVGVSRWLW
jgi:hypothetical protein